MEKEIRAAGEACCVTLYLTCSLHRQPRQAVKMGHHRQHCVGSCVKVFHIALHSMLQTELCTTFLCIVHLCHSSAAPHMQPLTCIAPRHCHSIQTVACLHRSKCTPPETAYQCPTRYYERDNFPLLVCMHHHMLMLAAAAVSSAAPSPQATAYPRPTRCVIRATISVILLCMQPHTTACCCLWCPLCLLLPPPHRRRQHTHAQRGA
jgi:hypothetical protein